MKYALPALLVVVLLIWWQGRQHDAVTRWEAHVEAAQLEAKKNAARADSLVIASDMYREQADSIQLVADSIAAIRPRLIVRIDSVPVPAEAVPFTAPRDTLITVLTAENESLRSVAKRLQMSTSDALTANALLRASVDSLSSVLDRRPKPRSRLIPTLGAGIMAGVCSDMRPCSGVGITLSWRL